MKITVVDARPEPYAAAPTLLFRLRLQVDTPVQAVLLRCLIKIEPRQRAYSSREQERLLELFGVPSRWAQTQKPVLWLNTSQVVPAIDGELEVDLPVSCTYDFEVASAKYFRALDEGDIPLSFLFSGTMFGREVVPIAWDTEARFALPVETWSALMEAYFPGAAWVRLGREAFDLLARYKSEHALLSLDEAVRRLIA